LNGNKNYKFTAQESVTTWKNQRVCTTFLLCTF